MQELLFQVQAEQVLLKSRLLKKTASMFVKISVSSGRLARMYLYNFEVKEGNN
jgi:hypothetical protein